MDCPCQEDSDDRLRAQRIADAVSGGDKVGASGDEVVEDHDVVGFVVDDESIVLA